MSHTSFPVVQLIGLQYSVLNGPGKIISGDAPPSAHFTSAVAVSLADPCQGLGSHQSSQNWISPLQKFCVEKFTLLSYVVVAVNAVSYVLFTIYSLFNQNCSHK